MPFSCGWVFENGPVKGVHLHLLIHRPNDLPMHPMTYRWAVLKRFQIKNEKGILKVEKFWSHQCEDYSLYKVISYCSKSSHSAMNAARPWSPATCRLTEYCPPLVLSN